jgi:hypothetical protein
MESATNPSPTFLLYLSEKARAIAANPLFATKVVTPEGRELAVVYIGRTITGDVTDEHVKRFAEEVSDYANRGQIEYGALYPLGNPGSEPTPLLVMQLSHHWIAPDGSKIFPSLDHATPTVLPEGAVEGPPRFMLLFYAASRYTRDELIAMNHNQPKGYFEEAGTPPEMVL